MNSDTLSHTIDRAAGARVIRDHSDPKLRAAICVESQVY